MDRSQRIHAGRTPASITDALAMRYASRSILVCHWHADRYRQRLTCRPLSEDCSRRISTPSLRLSTDFAARRGKLGCASHPVPDLSGHHLVDGSAAGALDPHSGVLEFEQRFVPSCMNDW